MNKKTKIVATAGPASENETVLTKMVQNGVDVFRLNFSHGDRAEHTERLRLIRKAAKRSGKTVGVLQDLTGPKLRVRSVPGGAITLTEGSLFVLTCETNPANAEEISVNYKDLARDVSAGDTILLDDGKIRLLVKSVSGPTIRTRVEVGGVLKNNKGMNVPGARLGVDTITSKDKKDLSFAIEHNVDFVALSFVRSANDVKRLKSMLARRGSTASVIVKIETAEAVEELESIVDEADGIMIARGDLAVEIPLEDVPVIQKRLIELCTLKGKPVITATQMLESMIEVPTPTRAEVSDVANAVFDGTDAVMLSAETAAGKYPVEAVAVMNRILSRSEGETLERISLNGSPKGSFNGAEGFVDAVTSAVVRIAHTVSATAIVALTDSGFTATMVARHRPHILTVAASMHPHVCRKLSLSYGCVPLHVKSNDPERAFGDVQKACVKEGILKKGDMVVATSGDKGGPTNSLSVRTIT